MASSLAFLSGVGALLWWHGPDWAAFRDGVHGGRVGVGGGRGRLQPALGHRARLRLAGRDQVGDAAAASGLPRSSSPRSRSVCSRTRCCPAGSASSPASPCSTGRSRRSRPGLWPMLVGTVFAHRVFDLVPVLILIIWVLFDGEDPELGVHEPLRSCSRSGWRCSCSRLRRARHHGQTRLDGMGSVRRIVTMARLRPRRHAQAHSGARRDLGQCAGWTCQIFAVWTAMKAFDIHEGLPAAGLVLILMNVATIDPALARQRRPRAGRGRDAAQRLVRRRLRDTGSPSASGFRRSRRRSASASASSSSRARGSRSRGCARCPAWSPPTMPETGEPAPEVEHEREPEGARVPG